MDSRELYLESLPSDKDTLQKVRHEVAREMRVGPSEPACRSRFQTTLSCMGKEPLW